MTAERPRPKVGVGLRVHVPENVKRVRRPPPPPAPAHDPMDDTCERCWETRLAHVCVREYVDSEGSVSSSACDEFIEPEEQLDVSELLTQDDLLR